MQEEEARPKGRGIRKWFGVFLLGFLFAFPLQLAVKSSWHRIVGPEKYRGQYIRCFDKDALQLRVGGNLLTVPAQYYETRYFFGGTRRGLPRCDAVGDSVGRNADVGRPADFPIEADRLGLLFWDPKFDTDVFAGPLKRVTVTLKSAEIPNSAYADMFKSMVDYARAIDQQIDASPQQSGFILRDRITTEPDLYATLITLPDFITTPIGYPLLIEACPVVHRDGRIFGHDGLRCKVSYPWNESMTLEYTFALADHPIEQLPKLDNDVRRLVRHLLSGPNSGQGASQ